MISTETTGLAAERAEKIRDILRARGVARVDELSERLGVSAATIRRDLREVARRGHVRRVHGGAVCLEGRLEEPLFEDKAVLAAGEKQRIAEAALAFVKRGDSVFLDGGSTVLALARLLGERTDPTVVTNSLRVAGTLSASGLRMILIGGEFRRLSQTFVGSLTAPILGQLHVDTAFVGTIGLSDREGLTTTDPREAYTKELVMAQACRVILLADSTKIGKISFVRFGGLAAADVLITDKGAAPADVRRFRKRGLKVLTV